MSNSVKKSRISEKMFNSLFKSVPFPSYVWKIVENDLILIEYNTSAEKITNGQIKNDLGRKASDIYKDQTEFYEGLSRCVKSQGNVFKEIKSICMTTEEEKFLSVNYSYIPPDLVLVHTEDITKKKKSEQILKREGEKAGLYLDLAGVILVALNKNGEITMLNKKGYEVLEYEEDELIGRNWFETCVPTHLRTQVLDVFSKLMSGEIEPTEFYENPIITKKGNEKIIAWHNAILYDDDGQIIGTLSSGEDITKQKQAKQKLKKSLETTEKILKSLPIGVISIGLDKRIRSVNKVALEVLGMDTEDEIVGKFCYSNICVAEKDHCPILDLKQKIDNSERVIINLEGEIIPILKTVLPINLGDENVLLEAFMDITDLKGAEQKLKESEEKLKKLNKELEQKVEERTKQLWKAAEDYRLLVEHAPLGVFLADQEGNIKLVNPLLLKILGSPSVEATKQINLLTFPLLKNAGVSAAVAQCLEKKESNISEFFYKSKWGKDLYCRLYLNPVRDETNQINGIQGIIEDITEFKKIEQKIRESEEQYRTMINSLADPLEVVDRDLKILLINPAFESWLEDLDIEKDVVGRTIFEAFPFLSSEIRKDYKQIFDTGEIQFTEGSTFIDGKEIISETRRIPIFKEGHVNQVLVITRDITERKRSETKYQELYKELEGLINSCPGIFYVFTEEGQFLRWNKEMETVTGYSHDEIMMMNPLDFFPSREKKKVADAIKRGLKQGYEEVETEILTKNNQRIPYFFTGSYIKTEGMVSVIGMGLDITELKKSEQELIESEERLSAFINSAPDSIFIWDSELNLVDCNKNGFNMISMGQKREDLIGQNILEIAPDLKEKGRYDKYMEVIKTGKPFYIDGVVPHPKFGDIIISIRAFKVGDMLGMITTDITKRKKAEQELIESEEKYRLLTENINDLIVVINTKFQIEYVNEEVNKKLLATTKKDILGKNILDFVHPDDKVMALNSLLKGIKDKEGTGEMRVANLKGQYIWFEVKGGAFINNKGELKGILIARDITERKQAEEKLRESEERYRTLVETMTDGLGIIDKNNCFTYVNVSFCEMIGYSSNELLGTRVFNYLDKTNQSIVEEQLIERRKGEAQPYVLMWNRKDRQKVYTIVAPKPLIDAEGNNIGSFAVITNITERIIAEQKLKESEAKYRNLFESSPNMIVLLNLSGKIIDVNPATLTQYGFESKDFIDKDFRVLNNYLPGNLPILAKKFKKLLTKGILEPIELPFHTKDRNIIWVNIQGSLVKIGGETYIQTVIQDINERKEAELKIKESEEKFRSLIETTSDWIWEVDENGVYTYSSPKIKDILGYNTEEVIGKTPFDFMPPNEADRVHNLFQEALQSNEPFINIENKNLHKDGSLIMLETSGVPFFNTDGKLQGYRGIDRDITEKKEAELKIKESEEKVKTLNDTFLEFTDDPFKNIQLLVDAAGKLLMSDCAAYNKIIDVNGNKILKTIAIWQEPPNYEREDNPIGHISTDIINMNREDIVIIKDLDKTKYVKTDPNVQKYRLKQYCGIAVKLNNEPVASFCVIYKENREMSEVDKDIIRILAKSASIEEQRLYSYQKIKDSEIKFKLIFDSIPDIFFLIDKDTTILDFKGREEDLFVPPEKLINSKLRDLMPKDTGALNYIATKKTLLTKQPQIIEYGLSIRDVYRHFEARHLYFSEDQVAVFVREITASKKAEQELIESEEKYRQLFENSPEIILLANPDGEVLEYNSAAEKAFGFRKDEVIGRYYYEFGVFDSDQISIIEKRYKETLRVKQKKFEEFKVKRKDGSSFWILYQSTIVKLGNKSYILTLAQDISEIKKAEKLIEEELIKLKTLDDIKNELITRASHEFKTPLTSILASAELFLNLFKGVYTEEMKQLIEIIYEGGKRLENLVKKTIDISLIESESISYMREREDIGKLINKCVNDLIYLADKRELSLELNVQENTFIQIDKNKITEVIKNILSNAIKNTPPKGIISISLKRMKKHLEISIKDTGVGFTEIELQRIFQKFGKIERYGKDFDVDIDGPGLGLYLAKQFIEMHGGNVWAESEGLNKGATFTIELPN